MKYLTLILLIAISLAKKSSLLYSLNEEVKKSGGSILTVNSYSFANKFIFERSKINYDIVLFLTVQERCPRCQVMEDYINDIAYSFNYENALKGDKEQRQLFFFKVFYSKETHEIFRKFEINDVPRLVYLQAKDSLNDLQGQKKILSYRDKSGLNDILEFVNRFSGRSVSYHEPFTKYITTQITILAIIVGGILTLRYTYQMIMEPKVWLALSLFAFVLSVGGSVHNIIHDVPWWKLERSPEGQIYVAEYIHKDSRMQWAGEGYLMSLLMVFASIILMLFVAVSKIQGQSLRRVLGMLLILAMYFIFNFINFLYRIKTPYYNPTFYPPEDYIRGPLANDQGNNI